MATGALRVTGCPQGNRLGVVGGETFGPTCPATREDPLGSQSSHLVGLPPARDNTPSAQHNFGLCPYGAEGEEGGLESGSQLPWLLPFRDAWPRSPAW